MVAAKCPEEATVSLSAILNLVGEFATIRKTLRRLSEQTIRARLEIVIVTTPGKEALIDTSCLASAGAWEIVTIPAMPTAAAGWAAGIREARAVSRSVRGPFLSRAPSGRTPSSRRTSKTAWLWAPPCATATPAPW